MTPPRLLIAQTDHALSDSFAPLLQRNGFELRFVQTGQDVLDFSKSPSRPDLIVIDQALQNPAAQDVCHVLKGDPVLSAIPVIILVPEQSTNLVSQILESDYGDVIIQPVNPQVLLARIRFLLRLKNAASADDAESVLYALTRTIEAKDSYTMGHADRVARFAVELGKKAGASEEEVDVLRKGGMLHDIGKIAIPDAILTKPGKYTPEEFDIMKKHPVLGCDICDKLRSVQDALPLIRHHHEKLNGSGYPDGLGGSQISPLVRIVTIVDIYDALRSRRSYKDAFSVDQTFATMWEEVNKGWWDKDLLALWEKQVRDGT